MHTEKCPVCNGRGSIHEYEFRGKSTACDDKEHVCHGCDGKTWVEVSDTERIVVSGSSIPYEPLFSFTPTVLIKTDAWYQYGVTLPMEEVSKYAVLIDELIEELKQIREMSSGHKFAIEKLSEQTLKKYEKIKI